MEAAGNEGYRVVAGLRLKQAPLLLLHREMGRCIAWLLRWSDKAGHGPRARCTRLIPGKFILGFVRPYLKKKISPVEQTVHSHSESLFKPGQDKCRLVHTWPICSWLWVASGFGFCPLVFS